MNPAIQAIIAPTVKNEPAQAGHASAASATGTAAAHDFAGALRAAAGNQAAGKVARRTAQSRVPNSDTGGATLPANGNRSPPPALPTQPMSSAASPFSAASPSTAASPSSAASLSTAASAPVPAPSAVLSPTVAASPAMAASPAVVTSPSVTVPPPGATPLPPSGAPVVGLAAAVGANDGANAGGEGQNAPDIAASTAAGAKSLGPSASDDIDGAGQQLGTAPPASALAAAGEAAGAAASRGTTAGSTPAGTTADATKATGAANASRSAAGISQAALAASRSSAAPRAENTAAGSTASTTTQSAAPNESAAPSASAQSTALAALESALAEGSDATGAAATAAQAAGSAATPVATAPALVVAQGPVLPSVNGTSDAAAIVTQVAASTLADASNGDAHGRGDAGSSGSSAGNSSAGNSSAAAQQLSANPSSAASTEASPAATLRVGAAVDSAEFPQDLADRVSFMVDSNLGSAKLQVHPPQLGPIELQIAVQGDRAQIWMSTHSAVTREALESSLPKLRDMLGAQGFGQVSVDISQRSFQERSASPAPYEWAPSAPRAAASASPQPTSAPRISSAAVDAYA